MVKEIIRDEATSLSEWNAVPGRTPRDATPDRIDLSQTICGIYFKFPLMLASMSCLYYGDRYDLAIAASREGIPPVIHYNQPLEFQEGIVRAVKKAKIEIGEIECIEEPVSATPNETLENVLEKVEKTGHSVIPILDRFRDFFGVFVNPFYDIQLDPRTVVTALPRELYIFKDGLKALREGVSEGEIKRTLVESSKHGQNYLPVLDNLGRLSKIVFIQKFPAYFCGASISTHEDWKDRAKACIEAGADFINIDASDGWSDFEIDVASEFKNRFPRIPLICGNFITAGGFNDIKDYADMVKIGMMTGAGCKTGEVKNVGLPLFAALEDIYHAREAYKGKKYIPLIGDGGIGAPPAMLVAFAFADIAMVGKYAAQFYEAAGLGLDASGKPTDVEGLTVKKEYWGEASLKARNIQRYGYSTRKSSLEEGEYGYVPHRGRLKPCVEDDFKAVRATMSNVGARNMQEYRDKVVLRRLSAVAMAERSPSKDMEVVRLRR